MEPALLSKRSLDLGLQGGGFRAQVLAFEVGAGVRRCLGGMKPRASIIFLLNESGHDRGLRYEGGLAIGS